MDIRNRIKDEYETAVEGLDRLTDYATLMQGLEAGRTTDNVTVMRIGKDMREVCGIALSALCELWSEVEEQETEEQHG